MNDLFLSFALIFLGGVAPLFFWRQFTVAKCIATVFISAGCLFGIVKAGAVLFQAKVISVSFHWAKVLPLAFRIDALSAFFLTAIFFVSFLAAVYCYHYMDNAGKAKGAAVSTLFFSLLIASMALVVVSDNMITFLLAWELMSLSSFFLVIYDYEKAKNRSAGYLYFIFSHVGAMFIVAAFGLMFTHTGSLGFDGATSLPGGIKALIFILALVGFGSKAGAFPLHVWLPHAHPAAPSHVSAVMSGVMIKTGIYGILKMIAVLSPQGQALGAVVLAVGIASGILGVVYALGQHDLKRLLAYHSVENIGIILIGIGIGMIGTASGRPVMAVLGFAGGLMHVFNHAIFKSLLFMGAGVVLKKTGTGSIDTLGGLLRRMKFTGATFLIGSLAISGLPPFNGFVSEFLIYMGGFKGVALRPSVFALSFLAIVSLAVIGGLALACFTKVVGVVFQGEPRGPAAENASEGGWTMRASMLVLAAACLVIGVFPATLFKMAIQVVSSLGLPYGRIPMEPFMQMAGNITRGAVLFLAVFILIAVVRAQIYRKKTVTASGTWGCGFTRPTVKMQYTGSSYAASIVEFFKPFAPVSEDHPPIRGRFPAKTTYHSHTGDIAEMHMNGLVVRPVLALFDKLRWIQHGDIHLYIGYIFLAIVVLLFFI